MHTNKATSAISELLHRKKVATVVKAAVDREAFRPWASSNMPGNANSSNQALSTNFGSAAGDLLVHEGMEGLMELLIDTFFLRLSLEIHANLPKLHCVILGDAVYLLDELSFPLQARCFGLVRGDRFLEGIKLGGLAEELRCLS